MEAHGKLVLGIAAGYFGQFSEGERLLEPLRSFGRPLAEMIGPLHYTALQALFDEGLPVICEYAERMPPPLSQVFFQQLGGAIARADEDTTASVIATASSTS